MEHFLEHKSKNQQLSFADFILLHYSKETPKEFQEHKERKLPFKALENNGTIMYTFPVLNYSFDAFISEFTIHKNDDTKYHQFLVSSYLSKIWQPPKFS
jgi:hypothetical protein